MHDDGHAGAVRDAIILAAGEGKRLRPLTLTEPKCMTRVNGTRIVDNAIDALAAAGCRRATIVSGYRSDLLRSTLGERRGGVDLSYVENADFASTNSMYSLALGLRAVEGACWVLEGDVFFEPAVLAVEPSHAITWLVDTACRAVDGSYVETEGGSARSAAIIRDLATLEPRHGKSVGILRLDGAGRATLLDWLEGAITQGRSNEYYDLTLGRRIAAGSVVGTADVAGKRWFEIDTLDDLAEASRLFAA